eukprot:3978559-Amphidinium_carterae.1
MWTTYGPRGHRCGLRWHFSYGYRQVHRSLTAANMQVNLKKTVVICNCVNAKRKLMRVWRAGRLPPPRVTTRDLGVDTRWAAWRCPVQCQRVVTFHPAMMRVRALSLSYSGCYLEQFG